MDEFETVRARRRQEGFKPKVAVRTPRVTADLVEWLRETYPPMCIKANQSEIDAHRYAAQVDLANRIIGFARGMDDHPGFSIQED